VAISDRSATSARSTSAAVLALTASPGRLARQQLGAEPWRLNVVLRLNILRSVSLRYAPIIPESTDRQPRRWHKILKCVLDY
jgi:hypothetical protein